MARRNHRRVKTEHQREIAEKRKEVERLQRIVDDFSKQSRTYHIPRKTKSNTNVFGVISDTHIGSLYERIDALTEFYKLLKSERIPLVLHAGDVFAGHKVYKGQEFEVYALGFEAQLEALKERFPRGIETHFIIGNHDASFKNLTGINVGKEIERARPDLHFLAPDVASVRLNGIKYQLVHPGGATAYAVSYKSQKIIESMEGGQKPRAVFIGHYHKADYMPMFRNVKGFQAGCFESQTPFMKKKPTPAHIGGWIIEDTVGKGLSDRFKAEFVGFYEPQDTKRI